MPLWGENARKLLKLLAVLLAPALQGAPQWLHHKPCGDRGAPGWLRLHRIVEAAVPHMVPAAYNSALLVVWVSPIVSLLLYR